MAASKAKAAVNTDTTREESPSEPAPNHRVYSLDELETVATVGEFSDPDWVRCSRAWRVR